MELVEGGVHLLDGVEGGDHGFGLGLVDHVLGLELLFLPVLDVSEHEDEVLLLAGLELYLDVVRCHGAPAVGLAVARASFHHGLGVAELVVEAHERFAVGVVAVDGDVDAVEGVVVAALLVFGLVVDDRAVDFDLAGREVALEVLHVGGGVPEAPFGEREELDAAHHVGGVGQRQLLDFGPRVQRDEEEDAGFDAVLEAGDAGVAHAVAALVFVERRLAGLPAGRPHGAAVVDVEVASAVVHRHVVVAITGDAAELGVLVERISAGGVGDEREEILVAQIVYPRPGRGRVGDDVFAVGVVKMSVFLHSLSV